MYDIDEIMDMLDGNNSTEIQEKGIELAKNIKCINVFILPLHKDCNKNVWENCAKILATKSDEELKPYLSDLLEWLQDCNWPGALIILERLQNFTKTEWLCSAFKESVGLAMAYDDDMWLTWLEEMLVNEELKKMLPIEMVNMLESIKSYYLNYDD